jgi:bifunctional UDP-N-acetylglucosamine pyrophosphorylase / glucosamine-1-phosphate N-acetyltransferase
VRSTVVILAAGRGTRMKSGLAKALHPLMGQPLIQHVLRSVMDVNPERIILVLGHQADTVRSVVDDPRLEVVLQAEQLGTGHAVQQAASALAAAPGPVVVLCADTPLITGSTIKKMIEHHQQSRSALTFLTARMENPFGYGRVVRHKAKVLRVVEEKDATTAQKKIQEVNAGIYCFDRKFLLSCLSVLGKNNAQGEYYLTDTIVLAKRKRLGVSTILCKDTGEVMGVNSRYDLSCAEAIMRCRINRKWMLEGVTLLHPDTIFIGNEVTLGRDVILYPGVRIEGRTRIGDGTTVYPGSRIVNSEIENNVSVKDCCVIEESSIAGGSSIGPFAHLRPQSAIGENAKIGNFVEVKKSTFGRGSKANHLAYIGDATIGKDVNIGAGVITCNFDGYDKYPTVIEDNVFVGSDAQLVAPVTIGHDAIVAAGATITEDVPADALAISRAPQRNREGYASARKMIKQRKK